MHVVHDVPAKFARALPEDSDVVPGTAMGVPIFSAQYRYFAVITPSNTALDIPCDGLICATDGTVTVVGADGIGAAVAITVKAGVEYRFACSKVTASGAGAVTGLWHRAPVAP